MSEWLKWLLLGLLSVVFGIVVLGSPYVASVAIATVTGVLLLVSGALQIVGGFSAQGAFNRILVIAMGAIMVFLGWSFLANPLEGTLTIATVLLILFAAGGIARIILSSRMRGTEFFWPTLISGILSLALAAYVWNYAVGDPAVLMRLLGILLGIEMLFNGFGLIFMALFIKSAGKQLA